MNHVLFYIIFKQACLVSPESSHGKNHNMKVHEYLVFWTRTGMYVHTLNACISFPFK